MLFRCRFSEPLFVIYSYCKFAYQLAFLGTVLCRSSWVSGEPTLVFVCGGLSLLFAVVVCFVSVSRFLIVVLFVCFFFFSFFFVVMSCVCFVFVCLFLVWFSCCWFFVCFLSLESPFVKRFICSTLSQRVVTTCCFDGSFSVFVQCSCWLLFLWRSLYGSVVDGLLMAVVEGRLMALLLMACWWLCRWWLCCWWSLNVFVVDGLLVALLLMVS